MEERNTLTGDVEPCKPWEAVEEDAVLLEAALFLAVEEEAEEELARYGPSTSEEEGGRCCDG